MKKLSFYFTFLMLVIICCSTKATIHQIEILDFTFDPPSPIIAPGDTVRWILVEGVHSTTSAPESAKQWNSGVMVFPGEFFDVVFTIADGFGPFPYYSTQDVGTMEAVLSYPDTCYSSGDINGDGTALTVADYVHFLRILAGELPWQDNLYQFDMNGDCVIDDGDVEKWESYFILGMGVFAPTFPVPTCCFPNTTVGVCCMSGDSCSIRSEDNCIALGGDYLGDGTNCIDSFPCDCCDGIRGNLNGDPLDEVNISDLTHFVAAIFSCDFGCFPCKKEADVNGDNSIDISDLTFLVKYLFLGGIPPVSCP